VQAFDHPLDLLRAPLDQPEALERLRARLRIADDEADERENCEERVVDLVGGAAGQLPERGHPAAAHHRAEHVRRRRRSLFRHGLQVGSDAAAAHPHRGAAALTRIGEGPEDAARPEGSSSASFVPIPRVP
jgi:hypothetical protein